MVAMAKAGIGAVAQVDNVCRWTKTPLYFGLRHTALDEPELAGIDGTTPGCMWCNIGGSCHRSGGFGLIGWLGNIGPGWTRMGRRPALLVLGDALGMVRGLDVGDVELTLGVVVFLHDGVGWAARAANDNDEQADHAASFHGVPSVLWVFAG